MPNVINMRELMDETRAAEGIRLEFDNETFEIDPPQLWTDEMLEVANRGDNLALSKMILGGEEAWQRFVTAGGSQTRLGLAISKATGMDMGKSLSSSVLSANTAKH